MNVKENTLIQSEQRYQCATKIMAQLDILARIQSLYEGKSVAIQSENIAFAVATIKKSRIRFYTPNYSFKMHIDDGNNLNINSSGSIELPASVAKNFSSNTKIYSFFFRNKKLFVARNNLTVVKSNILSLTIVNQTLSNLSEPIKIIFTSNISDSRVSCRYWQEEKGMYYFEICILTNICF